MSSPLPFLLAILFFCCFIEACNKPSPEKAFGIAVLNSNMLVGFSNGGLERELEAPSVKMGKTENEYVPIKRKEVMEAKIRFVEENYEKLKAFSETDDTKDIIRTSIALHEFILPVYKNEFMQLANLYDEGASKENIEEQKRSIKEKYSTKFEMLYHELISSGKLFAKEHAIKVNWAM